MRLSYREAAISRRTASNNERGTSMARVLADGQTLDNINISLPRGAVITGRVTDEFGDPAPSVSVSLMRLQFQQGQQRLVPAGAGGFPGTNDIGEYRIFGLPPGQYYVAA